MNSDGESRKVLAFHAIHEGKNHICAICKSWNRVSFTLTRRALIRRAFFLKLLYLFFKISTHIFKNGFVCLFLSIVIWYFQDCRVVVVVFVFSLDVDMNEFASAELTLQVKCESCNHFHIMAFWVLRCHKNLEWCGWKNSFQMRSGIKIISGFHKKRIHIWHGTSNSLSFNTQNMGSFTFTTVNNRVTVIDSK